MATSIPVPRLSPRQRQLCEVIQALTVAKGYPPSLREAAEVMGLHTSRVAQLANTTARKGAITRDPRVARSWRVVKPEAPAKRGR